MADTAVPVVGEIIANLGGTMTAKTLVPALEELKDQIGEGGITGAVDAWMDTNGDTYIHEYITEHGLEVGYTVTDGDLAVVLQ